MCITRTLTAPYQVTSDLPAPDQIEKENMVTPICFLIIEYKHW